MDNYRNLEFDQEYALQIYFKPMEENFKNSVRSLPQLCYNFWFNLCVLNRIGLWRKYVYLQTSWKSRMLISST
jgi:hypothetical protein